MLRRPPRWITRFLKPGVVIFFLVEVFYQIWRTFYLFLPKYCTMLRRHLPEVTTPAAGVYDVICGSLQRPSTRVYIAIYGSLQSHPMTPSQYFMLSYPMSSNYIPKKNSRFSALYNILPQDKELFLTNMLNGFTKISFFFYPNSKYIIIQVVTTFSIMLQRLLRCHLLQSRQISDNETRLQCHFRFQISVGCPPSLS